VEQIGNWHTRDVKAEMESEMEKSIANLAFAAIVITTIISMFNFAARSLESIQEES
jgi:hypothetical protein